MRTLYLSAYEVEELESWLSSLRLGRKYELFFETWKPIGLTQTDYSRNAWQ